MTANDLKGKKVVLTSKIEFDVEQDTDWIDIIKDRIGEDSFTKEELLEFLFRNNYLDLELDFHLNTNIQIEQL